jgi:hypothetical protein
MILLARSSIVYSYVKGVVNYINWSLRIKTNLRLLAHIVTNYKLLRIRIIVLIEDYIIVSYAKCIGVVSIIFRRRMMLIIRCASSASHLVRFISILELLLNLFLKSICIDLSVKFREMRLLIPYFVTC